MTTHIFTYAYELTLPYFNSALEYYIAPDQAIMASGAMHCLCCLSRQLYHLLPLSSQVLHLRLMCKPCKQLSGARRRVMHQPGFRSVQNFSDFQDGEIMSTLTPAANVTIDVDEINGTDGLH